MMGYYFGMFKAANGSKFGILKAAIPWALAELRLILWLFRLMVQPCSFVAAFLELSNGILRRVSFGATCSTQYAKSIDLLSRKTVVYWQPASFPTPEVRVHLFTSTRQEKKLMTYSRL